MPRRYPKAKWKWKKMNSYIIFVVTFSTFIILSYFINLNELWKFAVAGAATGLSAVVVLRLLKRWLVSISRLTHFERHRQSVQRKITEKSPCIRRNIFGSCHSRTKISDAQYSHILAPCPIYDWSGNSWACKTIVKYAETTFIFGSVSKLSLQKCVSVYFGCRKGNIKLLQKHRVLPRRNKNFRRFGSVLFRR